MKKATVSSTPKMSDASPYSVLCTIMFEPLIVLVNYFHKLLIQKTVDFRTARFDILKA